MNLKRKCHTRELGWEKAEANSIIGISVFHITRFSGYRVTKEWHFPI